MTPRWNFSLTKPVSVPLLQCSRTQPFYQHLAHGSYSAHMTWRSEWILPVIQTGIPRLTFDLIDQFKLDYKLIWFQTPESKLFRWMHLKTHLDLGSPKLTRVPVLFAGKLGAMLGMTHAGQPSCLHWRSARDRVNPFDFQEETQEDQDEKETLLLSPPPF